MAGHVTPTLAALAAEVRALLPQLREALDLENTTPVGSEAHKQGSAILAPLEVRFERLCQLVWAQPPTPDGVVLMAEITQHAALDWPPPHQQIPQTGGDYIDTPGRIELGHLAMAVLALAGKHYCQSDPVSGGCRHSD